MASMWILWHDGDHFAIAPNEAGFATLKETVCESLSDAIDTARERGDPDEPLRIYESDPACSNGKPEVKFAEGTCARPPMHRKRK